MARRISLACRIPLWRRKIKYPLYQDGDPQLRILLPQFWMKIIKPDTDIPPNHVHFKVHPQMSKYDIKQYLEKIYNVSVVRVNTEVRAGEVVPTGPHRPKHRRPKIQEADEKLAYVTLASGMTFKYPPSYEEMGKKSEIETQHEQVKLGGDLVNKNLKKNKWDRLSLPPWLR